MDFFSRPQGHHSVPALQVDICPEIEKNSHHLEVPKINSTMEWSAPLMVLQIDFSFELKDSRVNIDLYWTLLTNINQFAFTQEILMHHSFSITGFFAEKFSIGMPHTVGKLVTVKIMVERSSQFREMITKLAFRGQNVKLSHM